MIITVTLNPALDKTGSVDLLKPGELNRLHNIQLDAGGKGINVSNLIHSLGGESIAVGFAGGSSGEALLSLIAQKGIKTDFVHISGITRTNVKVLDKDGKLTEINEPGPEISTSEWQEMEQKLCGFGKAGNIIILSGSLPPGIAKNSYQKLCAILRQSKAAVFLDTDGEALKYALESTPEVIPDCIKPNKHELIEYFGIEDDKNITDTKLMELCRYLLCKGIKLVALSMGKDGAIFVNKNGAWRSPALTIEVRSSVGAGDSMIGALALGLEQNMPDEQCFALAMAASVAACTTEGTNAPSRVLVDTLLTKVRIKKIG